MAKLKRFDGKLPSNQRIDVDYTGKKPKVKFTPIKLPANKKDKKKGKKWSTTKKDAIDQNTFGTHTMLLLVIFVLIGTIAYLYLYSSTDYPTDCVVVLDEYNYNFSIGTNLTDYLNNSASIFLSKDYNYDAVMGADFYCDGNTTHYSTRFDTMDDSLGITPPGFYWTSTESIGMQLWPILRFFLWIIIFFIVFGKINGLITRWLVTKPFYQKWLPEHNAKQRWKSYKKFTAKDFDKDTSPFVEIPNFKNVSIEYKTFGDFSDQLQKIKIREHRYHKYNTKTKKVGKLRVEILKWTARFHFDKVPKDGYMEVIYY